MIEKRYDITSLMPLIYPPPPFLPATCVRTLYIGLKRKPLLFIFAKKQKFAYFSWNFCFCDRFCKSFHKKLFSRDIFCESFHENFHFCLFFDNHFCVFEAFCHIINFFKWFLGNIHQCYRSGYIFSWLMDPDPHSKWQIFTKQKIVAKTKFFVKNFVKAKIGHESFRTNFCNFSYAFFVKIRKQKFSFEP
jgi:hypothetical protein